MKRIFVITLSGLLFFSCKTKQSLTAVPTPPIEIETRNLDTLVVEAPKPDELKTPEEYHLPIYRPSHKRVNDLIHTKLELRFDWEKEQVLGIATLSLKPYFYATDVAILDAKGFDFHKITLEGSDTPLKYDYDGEKITIHLGKEFNKGEQYKLLIDYTASPSQSGGSAAITSDKGLFFINPKGEDGNKPQQIWTQGETENNSRWFPTIDKPNERCTEEMYLTVQDRFKTLSNGLLVSSTENSDGTRTDYWKMDLPHAPYLFMIAIGEYAVIEDEWNGKPVEYYVEPKYEKYAKDIFPHTPELLGFFSERLGVPYPWPKYSQVVVRDYVSGAMENTTAVIFGEFMQGTKRELIDNQSNENVVAHEMFHHWFGDYVTCESWSNLTLNEGFANYSEYLWLEHKYGKDAADYHLMTELRGYLASARQGIHPLIYFGYADKEDMFDGHSYNKGGLTLHLLRNYLGDDAFFAGLKKYLTDNKFSSVEAHELRLAMEEVSGEDLNWFFNQWFFGEGQPDLKIDYQYDELAKTESITVEQTQNPEKMPAIFELPVAIDIYDGSGQAVRHRVRVNERLQTFTFAAAEKPKLVNFDAKKILLGEKTENKTDEEYIFQYQHAPKFLDRYEALTALKDSDNPQAKAVFKIALKDDFWVLKAIALDSYSPDEEGWKTIVQLAENDPNSRIRGAALKKLGGSGNVQYAAIVKNAIEKDSVYNVISSGLQALIELDKPAALEIAKSLEGEDNGEIISAIGEIYLQTGEQQYLPFFEKNWDKVNGFNAITFIDDYSQLAASADSATMLDAAKKMKNIAVNMSSPPFRRYAGMAGINNLHAALSGQLDAADEASKEGFLEEDAQLLQFINEIKASEENSRLRAMYQRFPAPSPKP